MFCFYCVYLFVCYSETEYEDHAIEAGAVLAWNPLLSSHSYLHLAVKPAVQSDPDQSDKSVSSVLFFCVCGFVFNIFFQQHVFVCLLCVLMFECLSDLYYCSVLLFLHFLL